MRGSIATYRESISRIADEVLDDEDDDLQLLQSRGGADATPLSSGRRHRRQPRSSLSMSPATPNGVVDSVEHDEIAKYKADIQKLQSSEAEIKALSFNYAAMLKEKEEQLSKLREENRSLKRNLESKVSIGSSSRESSLSGSKQNGYSSGVSQAGQLNGVHKVSGSQGYEKGGTDVQEANNTSMAALKATFETEIKTLKVQLNSQREKATEMMKKLDDEYKRNANSQRELNELKIDNEGRVKDMEELRKKLNEKMSELRLLQDELSKREIGQVSEASSVQSLKTLITTLQKENAELKIEKDKLEADMTNMKSSMQRGTEDSLNAPAMVSNLEKVTEEMASSMSTLKKSLQDTSLERDKALQDLARLKQHLLDKELEDSEKMDEDSKIIEELRANSEHQRIHILQLERALRHEAAKEEESKRLRNEELQKSNAMINDLRRELTNCMNALESKNIELLNLQTALGQFYAESEASDRLGSDLAKARGELSRLSDSLKLANQGLENSRREKEEVVAKLAEAERMLADGKHSMQKLEEDNSRLRRALEQSMTTVNRLSLDSDNFVDRRIIIKLLVTYFQRNHSKEVLDLMVRMLGFSEEDKQRVGFAQHTAGKGVVRGVLGLPGRLVGGILGGGQSTETSTQAPSDNQSFADLWVDFLLKETEEREKRETEEREKRESAAAAKLSSSTQEKNQVPSISSASSFQPSDFSAKLASNPLKQIQPLGHSDAEFASIPLTSNQSPFLRPPPR